MIVYHSIKYLLLKNDYKNFVINSVNNSFDFDTATINSKELKIFLASIKSHRWNSPQTTYEKVKNKQIYFGNFINS